MCDPVDRAVRKPSLQRVPKMDGKLRPLDRSVTPLRRAGHTDIAPLLP